MAFTTMLAMVFALVPVLTPPAMAAVTALDAEPEAESNQMWDGDTTHDFWAEVVTDDGTPENEDVDFAVTAGPNQDFAENGVNVADGSCGYDSGAGTAQDPAIYVCSYENTDETPGTDTIRVFADNNNNDVRDTNEPFDDITKTWVGEPFSLTMTPESDSAAVGTCNEFTVTLTDVNGQPIEDATVRIVRNHADEDATDDDLDPCGDSTYVEDEQDEGDDEGALQNTDEDGQVTFGISSDVAGTETVRAYYDTNGNGDFNAGEPTDTSTKTWTAGGTEAVTTLDCEPENSTNPTNTNHTVTCTATNAQGNEVNNVTVQFQETGPATPNTTTCTTGDTGNGECEAVFTSTTAGQSTITAWVNQTGGGTAGPDAGEPQDTVNKTWTAAPQNVHLNLYCEDYAAAGQTADNCLNPAEAGQESVEFTARVGEDDNNEPVAGVRVDFFIDDANDDDYDLSPESCTTGANGECSVTVTNEDLEDGDWVVVCADVAGSDEGDTSDCAEKAWEDREATNLDARPNRDVNQVGTSHTVCATLTDQFGDPVQGGDLDFDVSGRNASGTAGHDRTTNASGEACFTYQDEGPTNTGGDDTITVTSDDTGDSEAVTKHWITEPAVADEVAIDMDPSNDGETNQDGFWFWLDDCDGNLDNLNDASWEETDTNSVDQGHLVCASAKTAGDQILYGHTMTFTSSGVGHFFEPAVQEEGGRVGCRSSDNNRYSPSHDDLGTTTTAMIEEDGYAKVCIHSTQPGSQQVTATMDGESDTGVKTWELDDRYARVLDCQPTSDTNPPGSTHTITCTVVDRFGNPVPGVTLQSYEEGPGDFQNCTTFVQNHYGQQRTVCEVATNEQGVALIRTTSATEGEQMIEVAIQADANEGANGRQGAPEDDDDQCDAREDAALPWQNPDDEDGDFPAGVCWVQVTKTWSTTATGSPSPTDGDPVDPGEARSLCNNANAGTERPLTNGGRLFVGTPGDDAIRGTPNDDIICGLAGDDALEGIGGDDLIIGNRGDDDIKGGGGNDRLRGGPGNDSLKGGAGDDDLRGGQGHDQLRGGGGDDSARGAAGNDEIRGGSGSDQLRGGRGHDTLLGGGGSDTMRGARGQDVLRDLKGRGNIFRGGPGNNDTAVGRANRGNVYSGIENLRQI